MAYSAPTRRLLPFALANWELELPTRPRLAARSTTVTVIAWIGILSGVWGCVMAVSLVVMSPSVAALLWLATSAAGLVTSLGLRERREWARRGLIAVLGYTTVMSFVGILRVELPASIAGQVDQATLEEAAAAARGALFAGAVVLSLINGVIIAKLCTARVRAEFDAEAASIEM